MPGKTLLWIGCGGCSGETQAMLGVEGQVSDLVDLIDVDSLRLLWHPSLADVDLSVVLQELLAGREHLSVLCVEGSIALADDGMFDIAGDVGKFHVIRSLCEQADYVLAMGACAAYGGCRLSLPSPVERSGCNSPLMLPAGSCPPSGAPARACP
jgi:uptake hydrogenase small subunit